MDFNKIDQLAQPGAFSTFDMEIFVPEIEKLEEGSVYLEVGTDRGRSLSIAKLVAGKNVSLYAVDIVKTDELSLYLENAPRALNPIEFLWMSSESAAKVWQERGMPKIHLLFIDGDHSYQGCKTDIESWYPYLAEGAVMLFHDCDESSPGVLQAVAEFVNTHTVKSFELFKRTDKNTSIAKVQL